MNVLKRSPMFPEIMVGEEQLILFFGDGVIQEERGGDTERDMLLSAVWKIENEQAVLRSSR